MHIWYLCFYLIVIRLLLLSMISIIIVSLIPRLIILSASSASSGILVLLLSLHLLLWIQHHMSEHAIITFRTCATYERETRRRKEWNLLEKNELSKNRKRVYVVYLKRNVCRESYYTFLQFIHYYYYCILYVDLSFLFNRSLLFVVLLNYLCILNSLKKIFLFWSSLFIFFEISIHKKCIYISVYLL